MEPGGGLDPHRQTHGVSQPGKFDEEGPQNRIVACIRLKSLSSSFSLNLFVNSIHLPMSMTFNEQQRPVLEAFQAVSQRIANNHHAFCAWP